MGRWADEFPEHSRTSCNDDNRANAHPSGKWCERCTALVMDDGDRASQGAAAGVPQGWSGWATQYPGKLPKLWGDLEIAELNFYPEEGARLIFLVECNAPSAPTQGADPKPADQQEVRSDD